MTHVEPSLPETPEKSGFEHEAGGEGGPGLVDVGTQPPSPPIGVPFATLLIPIFDPFSGPYDAVEIDAQSFTGSVESLIGVAGEVNGHESLCLFFGTLSAGSIRLAHGEGVDCKGTALIPIPGSTADDLGRLPLV